MSSTQSIDDSSSMSLSPRPKAQKPEKRWTWKKPEGKPKRPLSAYNLFFRLERDLLVKSGGNAGSAALSSDEIMMAVSNILAEIAKERKAEEEAGVPTKPKRQHRRGKVNLGFKDVAKNVAGRWKNLDQKMRTIFEAAAALEKKRYHDSLKKWNAEQNAKSNKKPKTKRSSNTKKRLSRASPSPKSIISTPTLFAPLSDSRDLPISPEPIRKADSGINLSFLTDIQGELDDYFQGVPIESQQELLGIYTPLDVEPMDFLNTSDNLQDPEPHLAEYDVLDALAMFDYGSTSNLNQMSSSYQEDQIKKNSHAISQIAAPSGTAKVTWTANMA